MEDLFKTFLYTGVGIVSATAEKLQSSVDGLVEKGKINEEDGEKVISDFFEDATEKRKEFEVNVKDFIGKGVEQFSWASKAEIETLNARIAVLEAQLAKK